jgi:hypothetical protein
MNILDFVILAVYFALVSWVGLPITAFTLFFLTLVLIVARFAQGERR